MGCLQHRLPILVCIPLLYSFGFSQPVYLTLPLTIQDSSVHQTIVHFGVHPGATHCTDPALGEFQLPPDWCFPLRCRPCAAFVNNRPGNSNCFGQGMHLDLRQYYSPTQIDTYKVTFYTGCPNSPITLRWPSNLGTYYDSARIHDEFGGLLYNVNMLSQDSILVAIPGIYSLLIRTWGPRGTTDVLLEEQIMPNAITFSQNYPNPFNPSTTLVYELDMSVQVTLKVFNVLGEELVALVNAFQQPGRYRISLDGTQLPSGVLLYRLTAGRQSMTKKMVLIR